MRPVALGSASGARAAGVSLLLTSATSTPLPSIVVATRGGVATSMATPIVSAVSSAFTRSSARRVSSVVLRAVDGGSLSSVSLGPSSSSSSSSSSASGGGVGGSKVTAVLPLDKVDLTSDVSIDLFGVLSLIVIW